MLLRMRCEIRAHPSSNEGPLGSMHEKHQVKTHINMEAFVAWRFWTGWLPIESSQGPPMSRRKGAWAGHPTIQTTGPSRVATSRPTIRTMCARVVGTSSAAAARPTNQTSLRFKRRVPGPSPSDGPNDGAIQRGGRRPVQRFRQRGRLNRGEAVRPTIPTMGPFNAARGTIPATGLSAEGGCGPSNDSNDGAVHREGPRPARRFEQRAPGGVHPMAGAVH